MLRWSHLPTSHAGRERKLDTVLGILVVLDMFFVISLIVVTEMGP